MPSWGTSGDQATAAGDYTYTAPGNGFVLIEVYSGGGAAGGQTTGVPLSTENGEASYVKDGATFVCRAYGGEGGRKNSSGSFLEAPGGTVGEGDTGNAGGKGGQASQLGGGGCGGPTGPGGDNSTTTYTGGAGGGGYAGKGGDGTVSKGPTPQPGSDAGGGGGADFNAGAAGGGAWSKKIAYPVTAGQVLSIHVGRGGIPGTYGGALQTAGGKGRVEITFTAGGGGTEYVDSGSGTITPSGTRADLLEHTGSGSGSTPASGTRSDLLEHSGSGSGSGTLSGSGTEQHEHAGTGSGTAPPLTEHLRATADADVLPYRYLRLLSDLTPVSVGADYSASAYVLGQSYSRQDSFGQVWVFLTWYDSSQVKLSEDYGSAVLYARGLVQSGTFTAPAGAAYVSVGIETDSPGFESVGDYIDLSGVALYGAAGLLRAFTAPADFDGAPAPNPYDRLGVVSVVTGGADEHEHVSSGTGSAPVTGTGDEVFGLETYYTDSGDGVAPITGSALEGHEAVSSGTGSAPLAGTALESVEHSGTASGTSPASGSASDALEHSSSASGSAPASGTRSDVLEYGDARSGTVPLSGNALEGVEHSGTGTSGVGIFAGLGYDELEHVAVALGLIPPYGSGLESWGIGLPELLGAVLDLVEANPAVLTLVEATLGEMHLSEANPATLEVQT